MTAPRQRLLGAALLAMLSAGCALQPTQPLPAPAPEVPATAQPAAPEPPAPPATTITEPRSHPESPWPRLRERFVFDPCNGGPSVLRWAHRYTASPQRFATTLDDAMPFLLLVTDEIVRLDLPGEFAMLPFVESDYRPLPGHRDDAAGMWQLMGATARAAGATVTRDYDERLDPGASTRAALGLIARYHEQFGDWRLADVAYNGGEYRARKLLGDREPGPLDAKESRVVDHDLNTRDHFARLLALSCIVADPGRFDTRLPEPSDDDHIVRVDLPGAMDLRLAARLSGVDIDTLRRYNAAWRSMAMRGNAPVLWLPATRVQRFEDDSAEIPQAWWADWRLQRIRHADTLAAAAASTGFPAELLATANGLDIDASLDSDQMLLLPGADDAGTDPAAGSPPGKSDAATRTHVIRGGDTLSGIARRYHVPVARLQRLNPGVKPDRLRPGDALRVPGNS